MMMQYTHYVTSSHHVTDFIADSFGRYISQSFNILDSCSYRWGGGGWADPSTRNDSFVVQTF